MRGSLARPAVVLCALLLVACGKKGPPLAPMVRVPAGIDTIGAQRVGNDVYLTLTVPLTNIDETRPVDIARVEVYGYTGRTAPPRGRFTEAATVVASVPVTPPAVAGTAAPAPPAPASAPALPAATPPASTPSVPGALPGASVTVLDALTPDELLQGPVLAPPAPVGSRPLPLDVEPVATGPLRRYYLAIGISSRGVPGPQGTPVDLPLFPLPDPPADVRLTATANNTVVSWEPPGGLVGFLLSSPLPAEPQPGQDPFAPPRPATAARTPAAPTGPLAYNVYLRTPEPVAISGAAGAAPPGPAPPGAAPPPPPWSAVPPSPINPVPLTETQLLDVVEFGRERCYRVRALRGTAPNVLISAPSEEACITAVDTFPPAPPAGLAAVAGEESISLIWEFGSDPDLAGYVVLRGEPGDATLQPLTASPIEGASFVDENVTAGRRFVYAVIAVDAAGNRSGESARVEETAR